MPKTLYLFRQQVLGNTPIELCLIRNTPVCSKYENMYSNSLPIRSSVRLEPTVDLNVSMIWGKYFGLVGFFVNSMIKNLLNSVNGNANSVTRTAVWSWFGFVAKDSSSSFTKLFANTADTKVSSLTFLWFPKSSMIFRKPIGLFSNLQHHIFALNRTKRRWW